MKKNLYLSIAAMVSNLASCSSDYVSADLQTYGLKGNVVAVIEIESSSDDSGDQDTHYQRTMGFDDWTHQVIMDKYNVYSKYNEVNFLEDFSFFFFLACTDVEDFPVELVARDNKGRLSSFEDERYNHCYWFYDSRNRLDSCFFGDDLQWYGTKFHYNKKNDVDEMTISGGTQAFSVTIITKFDNYAYDKHRNWISRIATSIGEYSTVYMMESTEVTTKKKHITKQERTIYYNDNPDTTQGEMPDESLGEVALELGGIYSFTNDEDNKQIEIDCEGAISTSQFLDEDYVYLTKINEATGEVKIYDIDYTKIFDGYLYDGGNTLSGTYKGKKTIMEGAYGY